MARIRSIKPQHVEDRELTQISLQAHLLWVLSWCFSDDEGIFENDPLWLRSTIFPRRTDIRIEQIDQWLDQLVKARFIIPFRHNDVGYFIHRTFKIHQRIDKPQPSKIDSATIQRIFEEHSVNDQGTVAPDRIVEDSIGKGKEVGADKLPTARKIFKTPEQEEIRKYFIAVMGDPKKSGYWPADKCHFQADKLLDHYTTNGWVQSKGKKIVDWKAACRNWIRNEIEGNFSPINGKKVTENGNSVPKNGISVQKIDESVHKNDKVADEIEYLFGRFRENPENVTLISTQIYQYDYLKKYKRISFSAEKTGEISANAEKIMRDKQLPVNADLQKSYMKKLGILEFFKQLIETGAEAVFNAEN